MMSKTHAPATIFAPLTSTNDLIEAIQNISGETRSVVIERLLEEHRVIGTNVRRDATTFGLRPYVWSDELIEFYRTTKSFLYETSVWNRSPLKMEMRWWIGGFLHRNNLTGKRVLTYGDGLGFDSTYMALHDCEVTCFEPSEECVRFARKVFDVNKVNVNVIRRPDELADGSFDIVVCLDVLEHVPSPDETVAQFARWLSPDGFLITHSPFFFIEPYHPTHLRSNMRHSGNDSMFLKNGLQPYDGKFFWDPIVLKKCPPNPQGRRLLSIRLGQPLLTIGRWLPEVHCLIARLMSKGESKWIRELESLAAS